MSLGDKGTLLWVLMLRALLNSTLSDNRLSFLGINIAPEGRDVQREFLSCFNVSLSSVFRSVNTPDSFSGAYTLRIQERLLFINLVYFGPVCVSLIINKQALLIGRRSWCEADRQTDWEQKPE